MVVKYLFCFGKGVGNANNMKFNQKFVCHNN